MNLQAGKKHRRHHRGKKQVQRKAQIHGRRDGSHHQRTLMEVRKVLGLQGSLHRHRRLNGRSIPGQITHPHQPHTVKQVALEDTVSN